jgi:hypothetical protein
MLVICLMIQASTFEAVEYLPPAHAVQEVARFEAPVLVIEPAAHAVQSATSDRVENCAAAHAVQVVAPVEAPVFVIEPAAHAAQSLSLFEPSAATNVAAGHSIQVPVLPLTGNSIYFPAWQ